MTRISNNRKRVRHEKITQFLKKAALISHKLKQLSSDLVIPESFFPCTEKTNVDYVNRTRSTCSSRQDQCMVQQSVKLLG